MKEDRLSGLALMHIYKHDVSFSAEDIVYDFADPEIEGRNFFFSYSD